MTDHVDDLSDRLAKVEARLSALTALCEALLALTPPISLQHTWAQVMAKWQVSLLDVSMDDPDDPDDARHVAFVREALDDLDLLVSSRV